MAMLSCSLIFLAGTFYVLSRISIYDEEKMFGDILEKDILREERKELVSKAEKYLLNSSQFFRDHSFELNYDAILSSNFVIGYANTGRLANSKTILSLQRAVIQDLSQKGFYEHLFTVGEIMSAPRFADERPNKLRMREDVDWSNYEESDNNYLQDRCFRELEEGCEMSTVCREKYSNVEDVMYTLTHDVLYYVLRMKKGCRDEPERIEQFCQRSWDEVHRTHHLLKISERGRFCDFDMFIEQMLFCGILGYTQFIKASWVAYAMEKMNNGYCIIKSLDLTSEHTPGLVCHHNTSFSQDSMAWKTGIIDGCSDHATALMQMLLAHFLYLESPKVGDDAKNRFLVNMD